MFKLAAFCLLMFALYLILKRLGHVFGILQLLLKAVENKNRNNG